MAPSGEGSLSHQALHDKHSIMLWRLLSCNHYLWHCSLLSPFDHLLILSVVCLLLSTLVRSLGALILPWNSNALQYQWGQWILVALLQRALSSFSCQRTNTAIWLLVFRSDQGSVSQGESWARAWHQHKASGWQAADRWPCQDGSFPQQLDSCRL